MPVGSRRPYTEMFEVAQNELVREAATGVEPKYMGAINQAYMNDLPTQLPERYIRQEGFINTMAAYSTGMVTVASGSSIVLGSSTSWTSTVSDAYINVTGYNRIIRTTYTNSTVLTFKNSQTWTEASAAGKTYQLIQDRYQLAADFSYMAMDNPEAPNIVSYMVNGYKVFLRPDTNEAFDRTIVPTTSAFFSSYTQKWEGAFPYLHLYPFPLNVDTISYLYIPVLNAMTEYTTGTITLTSGISVVGSGTLFTNISTANTYYIRNDADGTGSASLWTQISTFVTDSTATLAGNFSGTSGTGLSYTISMISKWPARFDDAMLFKACLIMDPDNVQSPKWTTLYTEAIGLDKGVESKRKRDTTLKSFFGMRGR